MELSCGRVHKIEGYHYLYNYATGENDHALHLRLQNEINLKVRASPQLNCS